MHIYVDRHGRMSPVHPLNDTSKLELLLNHLKQLNDLDHMEYYWFDVLHWFPTKEDEANAEKTPENKRTEAQKNILKKKDEREWRARCKADEEEIRRNHKNFVNHGIMPIPRGPR